VHPDRQDGEEQRPAAEEAFKIMHQAYAELKDIV
jgi:curved DNA-binding protein CbpA